MMNRITSYKSIAAALAMLFLLLTGCRHKMVDDLLSIDLDQYQPIEEFAAAYDSLTVRIQNDSSPLAINIE